ncbi:MAG: hypothetical protein K8R85_14735 [Bacteroidetes bacterium]|nr:hypothetical protein [Bacteroidota bacterium]
MNAKDILTLTISILAFGLALVTLILNRKISFKKTVKDKQLEVVYELLGLLGHNEINFMCQAENNSFMTGLGLYHLTYTNLKEKHKELFGRKHFFFQADCFDSFKFLQLLGNPFLPREIYNVMDKFYYSKTKLYTFDQVMETKDFVALITLGQMSNKMNYFEAGSTDHKTFENFHTLVIELYSTLNAWLDKYEAGDLKFKMDRQIR